MEITYFQPVQGSYLNNEAITFKNNGSVAVDMDGWTLKDEGVRIYTFEDVVLNAGETVTVHSGEGTDSQTNLYWQRDTSVWNNDGDVCFLRDENGLLVVSWRYDLVDGVYLWEKH